MKKALINWLGLLGVISLLSYTAAVVFSPLAYPGYNWIAQAVSDLSASNAPSQMLWSQLSSLYGVCSVVSITLVCIYMGGYRDKRYKPLAIWATTALLLMFAGAIGVGIVPKEYFGIPERFSVFAATGFNAVLGVYLFRGFKSKHIVEEVS